MPETLEGNALNKSDKTPWPLKDMIFGASIPVLFLILSYVLYEIDQVRYRPWLLPPFYFFLTVLSDLSLFLYSVYILRRRNFGILFSPVGAPYIFKELLKSFFILFLISLPIGLVITLIEMISKTEFTTPETWKYLPNSFFSLFILFFGFTLGPVCEEVFFRGFLYNALKTRVSTVGATLTQAAFFGFLHYSNLWNVFTAFLLGIALAIVYEKRKSLLSPIFVHGITNAMFFIPLFILALQNIHFPAANWDDAKMQPYWLSSFPPEQIERQKDGIQQWQYAINKWGTKGSRQWKKEANAFNAVWAWFPEDRTACAKAKLGIVTIYLQYLGDYRRAIIGADNLLSQYPEQKEQCASALAKKGWSYYFLRDFQNSRLAFNKVVNEFKEYRDAIESAQKGISGLDFLEKR